ncbi:MAG TPA: hypothetical protein VLK34_06100 [Nocardioidaceae bacterium]|nr:hypothetical protein [Nocardioidaceae bacterium]
MKAIARLAPILAVVSALSLVSACGSDSSDGSASAPTKTVETGDIARVVSVSVHKSGGLKPTDETRVFSEDGKPPTGYSQQDVDNALHAAALLAASPVTQPRLPQGMCADCYQYTITLTFADGSSTSYNVTGGIQQPPLLSALLAATS